MLKRTVVSLLALLLCLGTAATAFAAQPVFENEIRVNNIQRSGYSTITDYGCGIGKDLDRGVLIMAADMGCVSPATGCRITFLLNRRLECQGDFEYCYKTMRTDYSHTSIGLYEEYTMEKRYQYEGNVSFIAFENTGYGQMVCAVELALAGYIWYP